MHLCLGDLGLVSRLTGRLALSRAAVFDGAEMLLQHLCNFVRTRAKAVDILGHLLCDRAVLGSNAFGLLPADQLTVDVFAILVG